MGMQRFGHAGIEVRDLAAADRSAGARRFVYGHARPVDRAIMEHCMDGASASRVLAALEGYRNADGGFGHALEPDVRAPHSQPIHTLTALELLRQAGIRAPAVADGCCDFLRRVGDDAVPALLDGALAYPAAAHWQGPFALQPDLSWTFGLVAELAWHGARHPWFEHARAVCLDAAAEAVTEEAHGLLYLMRFAATVAARDIRRQMLARCREALSRAAFYVSETPVARYGLTPLHYAPSPVSAVGEHFDPALIEAHLDDLMDAQQGDGGWPIRFEPPSEAAFWEWRGRWTVEALIILGAYGRL